MKATVTGAAGFIGSHLCQRLLKENWSVVGIDNFDNFYDPKIKRGNIKDCLENKQFKLVEADIRDSAAMNKTVLSFILRQRPASGPRLSNRPFTQM